MDKRIKYITYYGDCDKDSLRCNSPAADNKTDYVIESLNKCGYSVDVISHSYISVKGLYFRSKVKIIGHNTFRYFGCFGKSKYKILNVLNRMYMDMGFFFWCFFNIRNREQIIVYHSLGYDNVFIKLSKIKRITIIGEIEEVYQDVHKQTVVRSKNEFQFIDCCSKYIFPTSYLDGKLNHKHKPAIIIHGIYSVEHRRDVIPFDSGKIHVVYAGTLDTRKGGAAAAAAAAEYLPERFHIHILGFGDKDQVSAILQTIKSVNTSSRAEVSYDGYLQGEEFIRFLQRCQIGLSTQDPTAVFNETSFPSKILTYLSNGLMVVTVRIPAIENSAVGRSLFYYDEQAPESIAKAVIQCAETSVCIDSSSLLDELDHDFVSALEKLLD